MRVYKGTTTKINLCDFCLNDFPDCPKANFIEFGDGLGNDNINKCSEYIGTSLPNNHPVELAPEYGVISSADSKVKS
jgi:hypothetical protein